MSDSTIPSNGPRSVANDAADYSDLVASFAPAQKQDPSRAKSPADDSASDVADDLASELAQGEPEIAQLTPQPESTRGRSNFDLLAHQTRWSMLAYLRNPVGTFFTVAMPIVLLVLFVSIFGNDILPNGVRTAIVYVPGLVTLSIVSSTAINLSVTMSISRERGLLRRVRGTPLPPWMFVCAQAIAGVALSSVMTVVLIVLGRVLYGVVLPVQAIPSLIVSVVIGSLAFCALGLALTTAIVSEESAPAIVNAIFLPLYFISDVFVPGEQLPAGMKFVGDLFPIRHFSVALQESFDPRLGDAIPFPWENWLVMIGWGLAAALVTVKWFSWSPRRD